MGSMVSGSQVCAKHMSGRFMQTFPSAQYFRTDVALEVSREHKTGLVISSVISLRTNLGGKKWLKIRSSDWEGGEYCDSVRKRSREATHMPLRLEQ